MKKVNIKKSAKDPSITKQLKRVAPKSKKKVVETSTESLVSQKIWESIKDLKIDLYGVANKTLSNYATISKPDSFKCYLTSKSPALFNVLSTLLNNKYVVEQQDKYIVVSASNIPIKSVVENETTSTFVEIWAQIKDVNLELFGLPTELVSKYCSPIAISDEKCYLNCNLAAVLPALERVLANKFTVDKEDKYIVVSKIKS